MNLCRILVVVTGLAVLAGCGENATRGGAVPTPYIPTPEPDPAAATDDTIEQAGFNDQIYSKDYFDYQIGDQIFFELDQSDLSEEAVTTLTEQANWMVQNPNYVAVVEGHADERGTREYNLALGARRAEAVRSFLVQNGVDDSRLTVVSYGKERPFAACSEETCWSKNRRAKTIVSEATGT